MQWFEMRLFPLFCSPYGFGGVELHRGLSRHIQESTARLRIVHHMQAKATAFPI